MEREEIFQRLVKVLRAECGSAVKGLVPTWEMNLFTDTDIDSIGLVKFMVGLGDEFDLCLENQNIARVETMGDVAELVLRLQRAAPPRARGRRIVQTPSQRISPVRRIGAFLSGLRPGTAAADHDADSS